MTAYRTSAEASRRRAASARAVLVARAPFERTGWMLRTQLEAHPDDDASRRELFEKLVRSEEFEDAIAVIREGTRLGAEPGWFVKELALWKPSSFDDDSLAMLAADAETGPYATVVLAARGEIASAERVARGALEEQSARTRIRRDVWLEVVAALFERDATSLACTMLDALDAALVPGERAISTVAMHLRDLAALAPSLHPELVRTLGRRIGSAARGSAVLAADPLLVYRYSDDVKRLRARAPELFALAFPKTVPLPSPLPLEQHRALLLVAFCIVATAFVYAMAMSLPRSWPQLHRPTLTTYTHATRTICGRWEETSYGCTISREIDEHRSRRDCDAAERYTADLVAWNDEVIHGERGVASSVTDQQVATIAVCTR